VGHHDAEVTMRRLVAVTAIIVIAAIAIAWTRSTQNSTPMTKQPAEMEASATMHPFEMMTQEGNNLPVQRWRDPF
jgi:hypothetical protein